MTILYDPTGTILRVCLASFLVGLLWALVAVAVIHTGSTRIAPRLPARLIWSAWRQKRMIWGLGVLLPMIGTVLFGELIGRRIGLVDIYWMARTDALLWIARLAGLMGYLLALLAVVVAAILRRRKRPAANGVRDAGRSAE